jgi:hypothetical protein
VARRLSKRATILVARRAKPHARTMEAARLGAKIVSVAPGYLSVIQARAREYCVQTGARLMPFGADMPEAISAIAAACSIGIEPRRGLVCLRLQRPCPWACSCMATRTLARRPGWPHVDTARCRRRDDPCSSGTLRARSEEQAPVPERSSIRGQGLGGDHGQQRIRPGAVLERDGTSGVGAAAKM